jgi:hypothetical protein
MVRYLLCLLALNMNAVVHSTPVYSYTGTFPLQAYLHSTPYAPMKAGTDGKLLAVPTSRGTELYDIESWQRSNKKS